MTFFRIIDLNISLDYVRSLFIDLNLVSYVSDLEGWSAAPKITDV